MDYYDALKIIERVDDDYELRIESLIDAAKIAAYAAEKYRSLYEWAMKHMELLRDVAAKPDIYPRTWEDNDEKHRSEVSCCGEDSV